MKKWLCSLVTIAITVIALLGIWQPQIISSSIDLLYGRWRYILSLFVFVLAALILVCCWRPQRKREGTSSLNTGDTDDTELSPPYPSSPNWTPISGFRYESHLKLVRLKDGLPGRSREAQYIVAEDYTVSFVFNGSRRKITVPKGMLTDFASVPPLFRAFVGRVGPHLEASIVHDYQYIAWQVTGLAPSEDMRRFADELMLVAMNAAGMCCKARLIYWAIRLFGCYAFFGKSPMPLILDEEQLPPCCYDDGDRKGCSRKVNPEVLEPGTDGVEAVENSNKTEG